MPVSQQSDKTVLTHPSGSSAEVYLYGATLTSWKSAGKEHIFLSEKAILDGSKAIRGGIPLVFPVFGKGKAPHVTASLPQHGFARISRWKLANSSEDAHSVTAQFGLDHTMISDEYRKAWPYDFSLIYTVKLSAESIETHLKIHNVGDKSFDFNTLLHTYFLIPDVHKVRVIGLSGLDYHDKVSSKFSKQEGEVVIRNEVDSVYANAPSENIQIQYGVQEQGAAEGINVHKNGLGDIVVWNPWSERAAGLADFGDEEYHRMICIEAGQVAEFIALAAGASWAGSQVLSLLTGSHHLVVTTCLHPSPAYSSTRTRSTMSGMDIDSTTTSDGIRATVEAGQMDNQSAEDELDHLFDLDDQEVFKGENPWHRTAPADLFTSKNADMDDLSADSPRQFMLFYRHFFPAKPYFQWLNYDTTPTPSKSFMNREFSFHLSDETFMRYQSYKNMDELKSELTRLCPTRIDLGAVYNIRPKDKNLVRAGAMVAVFKEMVFDIDMTDYDEIRTCCSGGDVCIKCWEFMTVALKIIDAALRDDFGFKHLLWVYSGRRGIHCWVGDERARMMTNEQRKAIVSYLEVIKGGAQQGKKVKLPNVLHPSLSRSYEIIQEHFRSLVFSSQDILTQPEHWEKMLAIIPDEAVKAQIREEWENAPTRAPSQKWGDLQTAIGDAISDSPKKKQILEHIPRDIIFQYTYPRLDEKVSTDVRHLLKSPFCIHPKTAIETCEEFDPSAAPTVPQLVKELNEYDAEHPATEDGPKLQDWQKTSLRGHVEVFERFVKGIHKDIRDKKRGEASKSLDF
ncbi:hypothetical protein BGZ99_008928 [Dissophora globulifera]|uniref:DNA primase n=1 Tax=Dissophora globulifera TaxID=979702 RepID=A0A9P6RQW7_9FUNG|nr:hypothetical protein BGZ99_008928 [Dissophora globulifera]